MEGAEYFELRRNEVWRIAAEAGKTVAKWRAETTVLDLAKREIERMESAFEHKNLSKGGRRAR